MSENVFKLAKGEDSATFHVEGSLVIVGRSDGTTAKLSRDQARKLYRELQRQGFKPVAPLDAVQRAPIPWKDDRH